MPLVSPVQSENPDPRKLAVTTQLDQVEDTAADTERKLYGSIDRQLGEASVTRKAVEAVLRGSVGSKLDQATQPAQRAFKKLQKQYDQKLSDAYTYGAHAGVIYPTMDDVVYGLQSGDLLGSVGIVPRSGPGPSSTDQVIPPAPVPAPHDGPPAGFRCPPDCIIAWDPLNGGWVCRNVQTGSLCEPVSAAPPPTPPAPAPVPIFPPDGGGHLVNQQDGVLCPNPGVFGGNVQLPPVRPGEHQCDPGFRMAQPFGKAQALTLTDPDGTVYAIEPWGTSSGVEGVTDDSLCFDFCHIARPGVPGAKEVRVVVPHGWRLFIRLCDSKLWAMPAGRNGFVSFTQYRPCGTPAPVPPAPVPAPAPQPAPCVQCCCNPCQCDKPKPTDKPPDEPKEQCLPAPKLDCHAEAKPKEVPQFKGDEQCDKFQQAADAYRGLQLDLLDWFTVAQQAADPKMWSGNVGQAFQALFGAKETFIPGLLRRLTAWIKERLKDAHNAIDCDAQTLAPVWMVMTVYKIIKHWTGADFPQFTTKLEQLSNFVCQSKMPTGTAADRAWLADVIDFETWKCWHKAAGDIIPEAQQVVKSERTRLDAREAFQAWRREYIDQARRDKLVRADGVIEPQDQAELEKITRAWPTLTELLRWMVRDVFDKDVVQRFQLDTDFDKKYTEQAEKYGKGLGIDTDFARNAWRAHWKNPGHTQMFAAVQRFRPGEAPANLVTTEEDVRQALKQDDVMPFWVERLVALSYHVVTRIDARRMYDLHTISEEQLTSYLQDGGYRKEDAERLTSYYKVQRRIREAKQSGYPGLRTAVQQFARGELAADDLLTIAQKLSVSDDQVNEVIQSAKLARVTWQRTQEIQGIKKRYVACLIDESEAHSELASAGLDGDDVPDLVAVWDYARKCRTREFTAAQLCHLRKQNLLTAAAQISALQEAGYSSYQARLISASCAADIEEAMRKEAERRAKELERQREKEERERKKCKPKPCPPGRESIDELLASAAELGAHPPGRNGDSETSAP